MRWRIQLRGNDGQIYTTPPITEAKMITRYLQTLQHIMICNGCWTKEQLIPASALNYIHKRYKYLAKRKKSLSINTDVL